MKFLVAVLSIVLVSNHIVSGHIHLEVPENVRKMAYILHEHCVEQTKVDGDWTLQMLRGAMPEDKNYGCYLHCIFDTIGLVAEDGTILFDQILHLLPDRHRETLMAAVRNCATIRKLIIPRQ